MNTLPSITLKWAQSLDGRAGTLAGHSQWITASESRIEAHRLRATHSVVMVGVGTILADDPQLTVRHCGGPNPIRVIVDSRLRIPLSAHVLRQDSGMSRVATTQAASKKKAKAIEALGARVDFLRAESGQVDLGELMRHLREEGLSSVLVEGGPSVITSAVRKHLGDEVAVFIAPKVIGTGLSAIGKLDIRDLRAAIAVDSVVVRQLGPDVLIHGRLRWQE